MRDPTVGLCHGPWATWISSFYQHSRDLLDYWINQIIMSAPAGKMWTTIRTVVIAGCEDNKFLARQRSKNRAWALLTNEDCQKSRMRDPIGSNYRYVRRNLGDECWDPAALESNSPVQLKPSTHVLCAGEGQTTVYARMKDWNTGGYTEERRLHDETGVMWTYPGDTKESRLRGKKILTWEATRHVRDYIKDLHRLGEPHQRLCAGFVQLVVQLQRLSSTSTNRTVSWCWIPTYIKLEIV